MTQADDGGTRAGDDPTLRDRASSAPQGSSGADAGGSPAPPPVSTSLDPSREGAGRRLLGRLRAVSGLVLTSAALAWLLGPKVPKHDKGRDEALVTALRARGIDGKAADVVWVDPPSGSATKPFRTSRALVRASPPPAPGQPPPAEGEVEPADLFLVDTRLSPEGVLLEVGEAYNLTETSAADESRAVVSGELVAYVAEPLVEGARPTVGVIDLRGMPPLPAEWTTRERVQQYLTNLQVTGRARGLDKQIYALDVKGDTKVALSWERSARVDGGKTKIELGLRVRAGERDGVLTHEALPDWVRVEERELARPGNTVTWAVDRVRGMPWFGDEKMQFVKWAAFTLLNFVESQKESVTGDTGAEGIAADLGQTELTEPTRAIPTDPELGWPPAPLEPWVTPALPGEGQWNSLEKDPFLRKIEGLPAPMITTFIRTDRMRKATRVYVALWDPRQVELHMMAGTVEPKSATGEAGPGRIPRTPEVMKRVIATSNAGFQAQHGEFGMMADGVVYLPPKPYAATVAVLKDGTTAFGTWPKDGTVPEHVRSYRQNMTVMVQDEKFNPYGRTWWGGAVPGAEDKVHTVRTGICLTKEEFVAYFYGADLSPEALSQAMIQARCKYGIALDMNAGHSGLELYKVAPEAELGSLGRPLQGDWEAEGDIQGMDGWRFRGRRLIRGMGLMNFPRYIRPEGRDFFYMTLRHLLPGPAVPVGPSPARPGEGEWKVKGLPQHGFPYALALTEVRPDAASPDASVRVLKLDPRTVLAKPASQVGADAKVVALVSPGEGKGALSVFHSPGSFAIAEAAPVTGAERLASGSAAPTPTSKAALGVSDEDGMLLYVEVASDKPAAQGNGKLLADLLGKLGCSQSVYLEAPLPLALGGDTDLAGKATHPPQAATSVKLVRTKAPGAGRFFEDTPVVPHSVWYPLQAHRVRYFKKKE